jgi:uncharacterized membrane protein YesL
VKDTYDELFLLALMNVVTVLLQVPIVTGPPAIAGLWAVGNRAAQGVVIGWSDYFGAFRKHFGRAWAMAGLHLAVLVVLASNFWFYSPGNNPFNISQELSLIIRAFWLALLFYWLLLSQHLLPLILEQEDQRLRVTLRNAFVLLMTRPGFSVLQSILIVAVAVISALLTVLWLLVTPAFLAVLTNEAVIVLLEPFRERMKAERAEADEEKN